MAIRNRITKEAETKIYFLVFFFFVAAMVSIIYNVAVDVFIVDDANAQSVSIFKPHYIERVETITNGSGANNNN